MTNRKLACLLSLILSCAVGATSGISQTVTNQAPANEFSANVAESNPGDIVRLADQLNYGLRVVTAEQRQYVAQIVALVDQGKLPRAMVNVIYTWSLERNPHVPFPYFQIALRALAQRRGIVVP